MFCDNSIFCDIRERLRCQLQIHSLECSLLWCFLRSSHVCACTGHGHRCHTHVQQMCVCVCTLQTGLQFIKSVYNIYYNNDWEHIIILMEKKIAFWGKLTSQSYSSFFWLYIKINWMECALKKIHPKQFEIVYGTSNKTCDHKFSSFQAIKIWFFLNLFYAFKSEMVKTVTLLAYTKKIKLILLTVESNPLLRVRSFQQFSSKYEYFTRFNIYKLSITIEKKWKSIHFLNETSTLRCWSPQIF